MLSIIRSRWMLAVALVCVIVFKQSVWHMQFFGDKMIPVGDMLSIALLLSAPVLLSRRRPWWTLVLLLAMNIWMYANVVYYNVWNHLLTVDMIRMAGNLRGFESSVTVGWNTDMLYWLALPDVAYTILLCLSLPFTLQRSGRIKSFLIALAVYLVTMPLFQYTGVYNKIITERKAYNERHGWAYHWFNMKPLFFPFTEAETAAWHSFLYQNDVHWDKPYVRNHGIVRYAMAIMVFDHEYQCHMSMLQGGDTALTEQEESLMEQRVRDESSFVPTRNLVVVIVESLENWVVDYETPYGQVMPNLYRAMQEHPCVHVRDVYTQLGYGGSSDGQLMTLTGLLPINKGVTVSLYADQPYPNYAHYYPNSITLNPSPGSWNKPVVNPHYGIRILEESDSIRNDEGLFHRLSCLNMPTPYFALVLTIDSHVPFRKAAEVDWPLDERFPEEAGRYIRCLHYTDEQLGRWLNGLTAADWQQTDIVITGDHSILFSAARNALETYEAERGGEPLGASFAVPLILFSPTLKGCSVAHEDAHQMDIYPTILHMIGCEDPLWKGLGIDLLDPTASRELMARDAKSLSDKLIRSGYFRERSTPNKK